MPPLHSSEITDLARQNKGLQKRLEIPLLKAKTFDTMIRLAKTDYKLDIRKKSGSWQRSS